MARPPSVEDEAVATEAVEVGTLLKENASLRDRLLRALADAENTRRQASRTAGDARRFAIADFARELLIVVDNLQRTLDAADGQAPATENAALIEGVQATLRVLIRTLERFGVRRISALGERFDPNLLRRSWRSTIPSSRPGPSPKWWSRAIRSMVGSCVRLAWLCPSGAFVPSPRSTTAPGVGLTLRRHVAHLKDLARCVSEFAPSYTHLIAATSLL